MSERSNAPGRPPILEVPEPEVRDEDITPEFRAQLAAARRRGARALREKPHAASASYDRATRTLTIMLTSGAGVIVPVDQLEALTGYTDDELAGVQVMPYGELLEWPDIDMHLSVPGIVQYIFSRKALASAARARRAKAEHTRLGAEGEDAR